ncbi:MAG: hypothetical protein OXC84_11340 [Gammaproteobacteria bacterium]|nr:hypothetical protein [Gammaproteobacteria bacterium]
MPPPAGRLPDWDALLSAAARLQAIVLNAVLVGGTAATLHAGHRRSLVHDPVLNDLQIHFADVLADLESVAGWKTARMTRPVMILGSLDGIETGIRQLIREAPLETETLEIGGVRLRIPTAAETLRIKAVLILKRNATRDYVDFAALADHLGAAETAKALEDFDRLYPQPNGESALQQLDPRWHHWEDVRQTCADHMSAVFDLAADREDQVVTARPNKQSSSTRLGAATTRESLPPAN